MSSGTTISRPAADEHLPYYSRYIDLVPDGDLVTLLGSQISETAAMLRSTPPDREEYAYAPGKWTIKDVVGHLTDIERVFSYRALSIGRNDPSQLANFDENAAVRAANYARLPLAALLAEFEAVRRATIHLAKNLAPEAMANRGIANGAVITPRALFYIIAGHERHHVAILRERYGVAMP